MAYYAEQYQGADGQTYRVARRDRHDTTPTHAMYPDGYDSRCTYCWLNQAHSEATHAAEITPGESEPYPWDGYDADKLA